MTVALPRPGSQRILASLEWLAQTRAMGDVDALNRGALAANRPVMEEL